MEEFIKAMMMAAAKQAAEQKQGNPGSMNHDEVSTIKADVTKNAKYAKMQYDQFLAAGFNEGQATRLTAAILN